MLKNYSRLQLGSRDHNFPKNYIMGYNLKNARNGKNMSKIPKWPSLKPLVLNSEFIRQSEFLENLEYIYRNNRWIAKPCSPANFSIKIFLTFFKIQTGRKSHSLMPGASSSVGHFDVLDTLFPFLAFLKLQPIIKFMKSITRKV